MQAHDSSMILNIFDPNDRIFEISTMRYRVKRCIKVCKRRKISHIWQTVLPIMSCMYAKLHWNLGKHDIFSWKSGINMYINFSMLGLNNDAFINLSIRCRHNMDMKQLNYTGLRWDSLKRNLCKRTDGWWLLHCGISLLTWQLCITDES